MLNLKKNEQRTDCLKKKKKLNFRKKKEKVLHNSDEHTTQEHLTRTVHKRKINYKISSGASHTESVRMFTQMSQLRGLIASSLLGQRPYNFRAIRYIRFRKSCTRASDTDKA